MYGFTIKAGTSVHALLKPPTHGRVPAQWLLYIGEVYRDGTHWRNDQTNTHYASQEAAAKALYAIVARPNVLKRARDKALGL